MRSKSPSTVGTLVALLLGPLIWGAYFVLVYELHALVCATGGRVAVLNAAWLPLLMWSGTGVALLLTLGHAIFPRYVHSLLRAGGDDRSFTRVASRLLSALSFVAIAFSALAISIVPICAALR